MINEKLGAATSNTSSSLSDVPFTSPTLLTARGDAADDDDDADKEDIVCPPPPPTNGQRKSTAAIRSVT